MRYVGFFSLLGLSCLATNVSAALRMSMQKIVTSHD